MCIWPSSGPHFTSLRSLSLINKEGGGEITTGCLTCEHKQPTPAPQSTLMPTPTPSGKAF